MSDNSNESMKPIVNESLLLMRSNSESHSKSVIGEFNIFISYRTNPDQCHAIAIKELIESSIEPQPKVFVAGAGGLRPSKIGFKPQIQAAAQSSRAFIAIITQHSKDREWLFFEAGAAWGRNQLFVPLLIGTSPSELATTMADYQAVRVSNCDEVELLIKSVAEAVNGTVKNTFRRKYPAFLKKIEKHQNPDNLGINNDENSLLSQAITLFDNGSREEANIIFDKLIEDTSCVEEKVEIEYMRIMSDPEKANKLWNLELLSLQSPKSYSLQFWLGYHESRFESSIKYYNECLALINGINDGDDRAKQFANFATIEIAIEKFKIGQQEMAIESLRQAMINDNRDLRSQAVTTLIDLDYVTHAYEKLVILSAGICDQPDSFTILKNLTELAYENKWNSLSVFFAKRADMANSSGSAANNLGRVYARLKLTSLAYIAFDKATDAGLSVSKVNIASLHSSSPIPAAGLKILQAHVGDFDAADHGYPYSTRASLEESLQNEQKEANEQYSLGEKQSGKLSYFACEAMRGIKFFSRAQLQFGFENEIKKMEVTDQNNFKLTSLIGGKEETLEVNFIGSAIGLWLGKINSTVILFCFPEDESMLEITIDLTESNSQPIIKKYLSISNSPGND
jgi:tetratricopeptide (TPR) repeat protein